MKFFRFLRFNAEGTRSLGLFLAQRKLAVYFEQCGAQYLRIILKLTSLAKPSARNADLFLTKCSNYVVVFLSNHTINLSVLGKVESNMSEKLLPSISGNHLIPKEKESEREREN